MTLPVVTLPKPKSSAARARARTAEVVRQAGAPGHILTPDRVPDAPWRTDVVPPLLSFVVYGIPAPQGSKRAAGMRGGKTVLKESSDYLAPWRTAVREMAKRAVRAHARETGRPWRSLNEPVLVSAVVTVPATAAATRRGDVYAEGSPDLDKLQRAIGDAISPTPLSASDTKGIPPTQMDAVKARLMEARRGDCILHDDAKIVAWDHVSKVYPGQRPDALAHSGVTIRVWRMQDLDAADRRPTLVRGGVTGMLAADLRAWARPLSRESWDEVATRLWSDPGGVLDASGAVSLRGRGITDDGARLVLRALALHGHEAFLPVLDTARED